MTLSEAGRSSEQVSIQALPTERSLSSVRSPLLYRELAELAVIGGWPALLDCDVNEALDYNDSYIEDLCSVDVPIATGTRHDPVRMRRLLRSIARNLASDAGVQKLTADVIADGASIDRNAVRTYLDALTAVFALAEVPAWSPALRSRTRLRSSAKLHLADPALACAALGITPSCLAGDPEYFGQVFESMVVHHLRVYAETLRGRVFHFRDGTGLEVDAIIEFADGGWAAVEAKLGSAMIETGEKHLLRLREDRVDINRLGSPEFLAIITGTEYGYTLPSGVHVIPLGALTA